MLYKWLFPSRNHFKNIPRVYLKIVLSGSGESYFIKNINKHNQHK